MVVVGSGVVSVMVVGRRGWRARGHEEAVVFVGVGRQRLLLWTALEAGGPDVGGAWDAAAAGVVVIVVVVGLGDFVPRCRRAAREDGELRLAVVASIWEMETILFASLLP